MDDLVKIVARGICIITRSTKSYKRIVRAFRDNKKGKKYNSNCFGSTLCFLGIGPNEPREVKWTDMIKFLEDKCIPCNESNGVVVAFRAGDNQLDHASVYLPTKYGTIMIHQQDYGHPIRFTLLSHYLKIPEIASELTPEFYRPKSSIGQLQKSL